MKRHIFALSVMLVALLNGCAPDTAITGLQTEYMTNPMGIDVAQPRFSWRMESARYGAAQAAFQILVAESEKQLKDGDYFFDSGRVDSSVSVGVEYTGPALKPCTRYWWKVKVLAENEDVAVSEPAWFETGLMSESIDAWDGAQWIGSEQPHFSRYRGSADIAFTLQLEQGASAGSVVFDYLDDDNYMQADFRIDAGRPRIVLSHVTEGERVEDAVIPVSLKGLNEPHDILLKTYATDYMKGCQVTIEVDGRQCGQTVTIQPYPVEVWKVNCRFLDFGFRQAEGDGVANFADLTITEPTWESTLYCSSESYRVEDDGALMLLSPAEATGAPMLRRPIEVSSGLVSARLYTTARGIYEYYVNGKRLSEDRFNPGSTDYNYRVMYSTYDLTPLLHQGTNAIGAMLGAGWWADFSGYATWWQDQFGNNLSLLAKVVLTYADGHSETIVSDGDWKVWDQGPITSDSFQNGEDYDARREVEGWSEGSFDDSAWINATVYEPYEGIIQYYIGNAVRPSLTLTAQSVSEPAPGVFVYDMGQNMVGVPQLRLKGTESQTITLKYGEMIYPEEVPEDPLPPLTAEDYAAQRGRVYNENYRGALSTDHYTFKDDQEVVYAPHFTFHGYRYIEIHGLDQALPLSAVEGLVLDSIGEQLSGFETDNANINRLFNNVVWGQRGNFLSIPTDCPQRDERLGWAGDAQIFARTASYNMNVDQFYTRWFQSMRDDQGEDGNYCDYVPKLGIPPTGFTRGGGAMGWSEVGIILPWQVFQQYADIRFLEEHYESMKAYMKYLENRSVNLLQPGEGYGDWVAVEHTNTPLTNTAYFAYDALLMSKIAEILGETIDAKYYQFLYDNIKANFNEAFVDEDGYTKTTDKVPPYNEWIAGGSDSEHVARTQTSYVVPLQASLFDTANLPKAIDHLVEDIEAHDYTITTGFIGTPYINNVLTKYGHSDIAWKLFEQTAYPSWLYPVLQGATTIWERWNSYTIKNGFGPVDMNSFNHYSLGAIEEWMMTSVLGIQRDEYAPGYKHILLQPAVGGTLKYARGHYNSIYGLIETAWEKTEDGYIYNVTVPANTTALFQPDGIIAKFDADKVDFITGGKYASISEGEIGWDLPAGKYSIKVRN